MTESYKTDAVRFQEYVAQLDLIVGTPGRHCRIGTSGDVPFWVVAYDGVPESGSQTGFTFGISSVPNRAWRFGQPELVMSVDSTDDDWLLSLGALASGLRGECPFSLGNVLRFGRPLSQESEMSAALLFWPTILDQEQQELKLSDRTIHFVQAYPIFDSEADAISKEGAERFFMKDGVVLSTVRRCRPS